MSTTTTNDNKEKTAPPSASPSSSSPSSSPEGMVVTDQKKNVSPTTTSTTMKGNRLGNWLGWAVWGWVAFTCVFFSLFMVAPLVWDIEAEYVRRIEEVEKQLPGLMAEEPKNYGVIGMANFGMLAMNHLLRVYRAHPVAYRFHLISGMVFFLCAPWQFLPIIRRRLPAFHRWSGRVYLVANLAMVALGVRLVDAMDAGTASSTLVFAMWSLFTGIMAFVTARKRDFVSHRLWILRNFSTGYAIFSMRNVGALLLVFLKFVLGVQVGANEKGEINKEQAELAIAALFWGTWTMHMMAMEIYLTFSSSSSRSRGIAQKKVD